jgi:hypothetical protein
VASPSRARLRLATAFGFIVGAVSVLTMMLRGAEPGSASMELSVQLMVRQAGLSKYPRTWVVRDQNFCAAYLLGIGAKVLRTDLVGGSCGFYGSSRRKVGLNCHSRCTARCGETFRRLKVLLSLSRHLRVPVTNHFGAIDTEWPFILTHHGGYKYCHRPRF